MPKPAELVEKHIQWVPLGLGVAFVGWMTWTYIANPPTVEVGGQSLGAGAIDPHTVQTSVTNIQDKMNQPGSVTIPVPDLAGPLRRGLAGPTSRPLAAGWSTARPLDLDLPKGGAGGTAPVTRPTTPVVVDVAEANRVKALAALPAATPIGTSRGVSTINPDSMVLAAQAVPPAPGTPGAGVGGVDREWVTAAFEIPMDGVTAAWVETRVPDQLLTTFLRVEVERQEQLPDGSWGNATIVRPLAKSQLAMNPMPPAGNGQLETAYRGWAEANQSEILQPGFYAVLGGSSWHMPGSKVIAGPGVAFDPRRYLNGPIPAELTDEQKEMVRQARRAEAERREAERRERRRNQANQPPPDDGGGRGRPPGGGGPGGMRFAPEPPSFFSFLPSDLAPSTATGPEGSAVVAFQARPPASRPPGYPPNLPWPPPGVGGDISPNPDNPGGDPGGMPGFQGGEPGMPGVPVEQAPDLGRIPSGPIDPRAWTDGPIKTFQHDETVTPGKTYRYRARYLLLNPLYAQPAAAAPDVAKAFTWASAWSDWTAPQEVPERISFFVNSRITTGATSVSFEIFQFVGGKMRSRTSTVAVGDIIGGMENLGDFTTGYTLIDIRRNPGGENYALILAPDGKTIIRRDNTSDTASGTYKDLRQQVSAGAAPAPVIPPP